MSRRKQARPRHLEASALVEEGHAPIMPPPAHSHILHNGVDIEPDAKEGNKTAGLKESLFFLACLREKRKNSVENDAAIDTRHTDISGEDGSEDEHVCGRCRAEFMTLADFLEHKKGCCSIATEKNQLNSMQLEDMATDGASDDAIEEDCSSSEAVGTTRAPTDAAHAAAGLLPATHVTLEALQGTKVAVAQFAYGTGSAAELAALQEALVALQQQQVVQLHIIQQLQAYVSSNGAPLNLSAGALEDRTPKSPEPGPPASPCSSTCETPKGSQATPPPLLAPTTGSESSAPATGLVTPPATLPPPPPDEPNTLELLQRHTEKALQETMSGGSFLLNGLGPSDALRVRRKPDGKPDDAYFRHRCRFCGKVFGSDSALQIHIRSHTGERPFKCNVCGNRFSTKGNLKVHFQRHRSKYPHVRMNPHPVPEHLDKHFPPLEPPGDRSSPPADPPPPTLLPAVSRALTGPSLGLQPSLSRADDVQCDVPSKHLRSASPTENSNQTMGLSGEESSALEDNDDKPLSLKTEKEGEADGASLESNSPKPPSSPMEECKDDVKGEDSKAGRAFAPFPAFFPPFSSSLAVAPYSLPPVTSGGCTPGVPPPAAGSDQLPLHADPAFYQDLLPKPGSNDNSWETLMEITRTSETSKLQQLVDNIEHKLSDPNQCVICHRVLSCRSALQMHYRTHTGERPFKCKICGRAFTTKGNLKTHMGVHRVKPPLRVLHKCPVCHKQFTNSLVLQQHVRMHAPVDMQPRFQSFPTTEDSKPPEPKQERESPPIASGSPRSSPPPNSDDRTVSPRPTSPSPLRPLSPERPPSQLTSLAALENQVKGINTSLQPPMPPFGPFGLGLSVAGYSRFEDHAPLFLGRPPELAPRDKSPGAAFSPSPSRANSEMSTGDERSTPGGSTIKSESPASGSPPASSGAPLDLTPRTTVMSRPVTTVASDMAARLFSSPLGGLAFPPPHPGRPNTTCQICFKTFACNSALEIHYRSHTKERPFKCTVCERGFSTKGNLKQHMLTHKIRDLPPQLFTTTTTSTSGTTHTSSDGSNGNALRSLERLPPLSVGNDDKGNNDRRPEAPKRPPGLPKHVCHVCNKPFSSSSSLQIHMRTHTGDKPFKCSICGRAFTTKGNLKVHMGTHMWNNGSSRRGRRMSLDLPSLPSIGPKPGDFPHPPPDLFYPYLSPGYVNGMLGPKMNEISVIQTAGEPRAGDEAEPNGAWGWKIACNVCSKICSSSVELEAHLKTHQLEQRDAGKGLSPKQEDLVA
ncbi:sal-like protein 3 [Ornithodoros turicata]|uniref:sal-like protein 3 n=1 Tax=Ornithodoros turicata TaxID=34597 RepID=UPI0031397613